MRLISRKEYVVTGYAVKVNPYSKSIVSLSDYEDSHSKVISVSLEHNHTAKLGSKITVIGNITAIPNSPTDILTGSTYYFKGTPLNSKYAEETHSVRSLISLLNNVYEKTYIKVSGYIVPDGEYPDGKKRYKMYESEEAYGDYRSASFRLHFDGEPTNVVGKNITIMGLPDLLNLSTIMHGLRCCVVVD